MVVADVLLRAIDPEWRIFGMLDYVEFSMAWLVFLAIPVALFQGRAVTVDLIDHYDLKGWLIRIGAVLTVLTLLLLVSQIIRPALDVLEWGEETFDLGIPKFYYWLSIWVGLGFACLAAALEALFPRS